MRWRVIGSLRDGRLESNRGGNLKGSRAGAEGEEGRVVVGGGDSFRPEMDRGMGKLGFGVRLRDRCFFSYGMRLLILGFYSSLFATK